MGWLRSYFDRRLECRNPKDQGNKLHQFKRLMQECDGLFERMNTDNRIDYIVLDGCHYYGLWILYGGTFEPYVSSEEGNDQSVSGQQISFSR